MHIDIVHSSAHTRALRLFPLAQLPLLLPLLSRSPPPGAAGRSYIPAMPAVPLRNHATPAAYPTHTSCADCALINATHAPASLRKGARFVGSSVEGGEGK